MHQAALDFVTATIRAHGARGPVYEIGSRNVNGGIRGLFPSEGYHGIDLYDGPGVDEVADAAVYIPPAVPRTVVCCEVLEHAEDAKRIVRQIAAVLAPGGRVILTMAGPCRMPHSGIDGGQLRAGEFYRNVMPDELRYWLHEFEQVEVVENIGPADLYATAVKP
jgi:SAM-dependent methyltransferase